MRRVEARGREGKEREGKLMGEEGQKKRKSVIVYFVKRGSTPAILTLSK